MAFNVNVKIWFEIDGQPVMGAGRYHLLQAIEEFGSLSEAAKSMKMSYKKAWKLVKVMNEAFKNPLVEKTKGGKGGGFSSLTEEGLEMMKRYKEVERDFLLSAEKITA
jgi:molybdate transport system regulatory protein